MKPAWYVTAAALALASSSCGGKGLYPVKGRVTYQGAPATGAAVFFHRQGGDPRNEHLIMGIVADDGSFEVVCGSLGKGAPQGNYDVLIQWKESRQPGKGPGERAADKLQGRYADPKGPLLQATVEARTNILLPFLLTDAETREPR
jgi:hypothetical protein